MPVPKETISNTVLRQVLSGVPGFAWPMYLAGATNQDKKDQIKVYVQSGATVTIVPASDYTITILTPDYWTFSITFLNPPGGPTDTIIIFRRTRGVVDQFPTSAFLTAEALNQRYDLDNLGINDSAYYQSKTNPMYSPKAVAERGVWDTSGSPDSNPALAPEDLQLPYLGTGSPTVGDVYTWGKKITNNPAVGDGEFEQVLIGSSSGGGTVAQLVQELAECNSSATAGGNFIGLWSAANPAIGWNPPLSGCFPGNLQGWFERMISTGPNPGDTGATQVGMQITGTGNYPVYNTGGNETTVQTYGNAFHNFGTPAARHYDSGSSFVGYSAWGLNAPVVAPDGNTYSANTVAGCLNRLNEDAISPTASGAAYVKFWDTNPGIPVSKSVQQGLNELWQSITNLDAVSTSTVVLAAAAPNITIPALTGDFANIDNIKMIVFEVEGQDSGSRVICGPFPAGSTTYGLGVPFAASANTRVLSIVKSAGANPSWTISRLAPWPTPPDLTVKLTAYLRAVF